MNPSILILDGDQKCQIRKEWQSRACVVIRKEESSQHIGDNCTCQDDFTMCPSHLNWVLTYLTSSFYLRIVRQYVRSLWRKHQHEYKWAPCSHQRPQRSEQHKSLFCLNDLGWAQRSYSMLKFQLRHGQTLTPYSATMSLSLAEVRLAWAQRSDWTN